MEKMLSKIILLFVVSLSIYFAIFFDIDIDLVITEFKSRGSFAVLLFVFFAVFATVLFIPGSIIGIVGGIVFGPYLGTLLVVISATFGSVISFLISRYFYNSRIVIYIKNIDSYKKIDKFTTKNSTDLLVITRLLPIFPFNLQNYYYGFTTISIKKYSVVTFFTLIPGTFIYCFFASKIYYDSQSVILYVLGFSTIIIVLYFITKFYLKNYL